MNKTSRLVQGALLVSAITLSVTACGQKRSTNRSRYTGTTSYFYTDCNNFYTNNNAKPTIAPLKQLQVKAYYSDQDEMKLVEKVVTISVQKDSDVYEAALKALQKSDDPKAIPLFDDLKFTSVKFDAAKGEMKLDLAFGPKTQLGAPGRRVICTSFKENRFSNFQK